MMKIHLCKTTFFQSIASVLKYRLLFYPFNISSISEMKPRFLREHVIIIFENSLIPAVLKKAIKYSVRIYKLQCSYRPDCCRQAKYSGAMFYCKGFFDTINKWMMKDHNYKAQQIIRGRLNFF